MSIIQEALKKVGNVAVEERPQPTNTVGIEKTGKPIFLDSPVTTVRQRARPARMNPVIFIILLIALVSAGLSIFQLLKKDVMNAPGDAPVVSSPIDSGAFMKRTDGQDAALQSGLAKAKFVLSGIMYLDGGSKAIMDNSIVREGDMVSGALVKKIEKNSVLLESMGLEFRIDLK